jgi:7-cyano-7-deazaguanine synthase
MDKRFHRAVALLSGGIDSTTALAIALKEAEDVYVLSFDYKQRHDIELQRAMRIVRWFRAQGKLKEDRHFIQKIDLRLWGGSALTDAEIEVPKERSVLEMASGIPVTYVPARNTVFLAFALSLAEAVAADAVYGGWNVLDYSGYPDCRPEYLKAMQGVFDLGTKHVDGGARIELNAPLVYLNKADIIKSGLSLQAPLDLTWSCYDPQLSAGAYIPCGKCDSCLLRAKGFSEAGLEDPALVEA